jgi:hypothetical protein
MNPAAVIADLGEHAGSGRVSRSLDHAQRRKAHQSY